MYLLLVLSIEVRTYVGQTAIFTLTVHSPTQTLLWSLANQTSLVILHIAIVLDCAAVTSTILQSGTMFLAQKILAYQEVTMLYWLLIIASIACVICMYSADAIDYFLM